MSTQAHVVEFRESPDHAWEIHHASLNGAPATAIKEYLETGMAVEEGEQAEELVRLTVVEVSSELAADNGVLSALLGSSAAKARGSVGVLLHGADRLAAEVAWLVQRGELDARSRAGDALLDYANELNDGHRETLGLEPLNGDLPALAQAGREGGDPE